MEHILVPQQNWLEIADENGGLHYGADQEWFSVLWRRKAGCGPTTAAEQMAYLAHTRVGMGPLCPLPVLERKPFAAYMDAVWEHVTPGFHGLNTIEKYSDGVRAFARARNVKVHLRELAVPKDADKRVPLADCVAFLRAGLEGGCPVAFLNLDNGQVENLDYWHWVLITGLILDGDKIAAVVADGGKQVEIDLGLWYATTTDRGGFVYLPSEGTA
ncbi:conserved hypothetical protein [uncultured Eubacteriales bacterium]|uniref:Peptidase C39-like domain-containing protein n=1 Tax=uncultured Eubacteriales bacterium TaxID=172733 RepID=A0A212KIL0_9FIRM|nr:conserved hypothetical protein [uncultured Eubacteriales bacterium]